VVRLSDHTSPLDKSRSFCQLACVWRLIADLEGSDNNWLAHLGMEHASTLNVYTISLYFAVVSLTSTGYGVSLKVSLPPEKLGGNLKS
jgi:hypothetical protein